ncbi:AAA family ATPase [Lentisphaera profundi]|uniref:AAA family ATPase n=1 Tax=Lentisphaera profundi TaxID=1658616 RepID=A0ABY7VY60_9BACT|nr:AAA family ATPase [Lentisphaera profundi]WDE98734.1 AAA family ATPase [Lentisphaera profundi]
MSAHLLIIEGPEPGKTIPLNEGIQFIGRDANTDICIDHPSISKIHASIDLRNDSLTLSDCDSTNGIKANGEKHKQVKLEDQETFLIGDILIRFISGSDIKETLADFANRIPILRSEIKKIIVGQDDVVGQILAGIFGGGHCLLTGVPGLAKTITINSISKVLNLDFKRIQFTPDLMPSDITGTTILDEDEQGRRSFKFVKGPIFTQLLLADEINRTPPKTQAALLEAMQEKQVTVGEKTMQLPSPFIVMATRNPVEQEGTYILPEAQLDRFMFNINIDYPTQNEEEEILRRTCTPNSYHLKQIFQAHDIIRFRNAIERIETSPLVISYVTSLARATRPGTDDCPPELSELIEYGAGPRAGQYLIRGAKAFAAMEGRSFTTCADIKKCAVPVLRHRISLSFKAQAIRINEDDLVHKLLELIPEPEIPQFV